MDFSHQKRMQKLLKKMGKSDNPDEATIGNLIAELLGNEIFEDIVDTETGIAPNGFIKLFAKLRELFNRLIEFFKSVFNK